ncbi:hypothetical protein Tco_1043022 [Tanacetum coccineum]|uniref:Uncharacterized protein n=1 Tax=Tanacetum coccineum TaxID=301880 RepID=A0ABQ5GN29_9ASTR
MVKICHGYEGNNTQLDEVPYHKLFDISGKQHKRSGPVVQQSGAISALTARNWTIMTRLRKLMNKSGSTLQSTWAKIQEVPMQIGTDAEPLETGLSLRGQGFNDRTVDYDQLVTKHDASSQTDVFSTMVTLRGLVKGKTRIAKAYEGNVTLLCILLRNIGYRSFWHDQICSILGYGDLIRQHHDKRVFTSRRDLQGKRLNIGIVDLILYTISLQETIPHQLLSCLLAKAHKLQAWLWHQDILISNSSTSLGFKKIL